MAVQFLFVGTKSSVKFNVERRQAKSSVKPQTRRIVDILIVWYLTGDVLLLVCRSRTVPSVANGRIEERLTSRGAYDPLMRIPAAHGYIASGGLTA